MTTAEKARLKEIERDYQHSSASSEIKFLLDLVRRQQKESNEDHLNLANNFNQYSADQEKIEALESSLEAYEKVIMVARQVAKHPRTWANLVEVLADLEKENK